MVLLYRMSYVVCFGLIRCLAFIVYPTLCISVVIHYKYTAIFSISKFFRQIFAHPKELQFNAKLYN